MCLSLLALLGLAACGGSSDSDGTLTQELLGTHSSTPLGCLQAARLSNVESRGRGFWRAENANPFFVITVQRFSTSAEARSAAKQADHLTRLAVGRYTVLGPSKGTNDGGVVGLVAGCFGGSTFSTP